MIEFAGIGRTTQPKTSWRWTQPTKSNQSSSIICGNSDIPSAADPKMFHSVHRRLRFRVLASNPKRRFPLADICFYFFIFGVGVCMDSDVMKLCALDWSVLVTTQGWMDLGPIFGVDHASQNIKVLLLLHFISHSFHHPIQRYHLCHFLLHHKFGDVDAKMVSNIICTFFDPYSIPINFSFC